MRLCIVGTGRCGSTLLQRMLNAHPKLFVFPETHWIPVLYEQFGSMDVAIEKLLDIVSRTHHVNGRPTTDLEAINTSELIKNHPVVSVRAFCDLLGNAYSEKAGKLYWADKTPDYGYCLTTIQSLWSDCKFVHLVRDGVAVVKSMSKHIGYQELALQNELFWCPLSLDFTAAPHDNPDISPERFVKLWRMRFLQTRNEASKISPRGILELRYEDLLKSTEASLRKITQMIGLDSPEYWLDHAANMVNPDKIDAGRPISFLKYFDATDRQLLADTGYPEHLS